ncbi:hypothetical protein SAMN05421780_11068 [Flexibacter flexilis DSM 6793]|uniref:Uncharacterized protein n=1 Tax=Flexibacter flexilis DSM 6793 TaxID=927664 RepID=A0A1I1MFL9_9BACT|nr:hypothetical protein [Flexibacter flexilis]SFC81443.1 hypothetical protein SAMN05421780_11068 [Flexibacter flexilis DSM 6793]
MTQENKIQFLAEFFAKKEIDDDDFFEQEHYAAQNYYHCLYRKYSSEFSPEWAKTIAFQEIIEWVLDDNFENNLQSPYGNKSLFQC